MTEPTCTPTLAPPAPACAMGANPKLAVPRTGWYPASVPPAMPGWYEREYEGVSFPDGMPEDWKLTPFDYWTGREWAHGIIDGEHHGYFMPNPAADLRWRGVAGDPKHFTHEAWAWPVTPPTVLLVRDGKGGFVPHEHAAAAVDLPIMEAGELWRNRLGNIVRVMDTRRPGDFPVYVARNPKHPALDGGYFVRADGRASAFTDPQPVDLVSRVPPSELVSNGMGEVTLRVPKEVAGRIALDPDGARAHLKAEADRALDEIIADNELPVAPPVSRTEKLLAAAVVSIVVLCAMYLVASALGIAPVWGSE